jgi:phosphopantothenoylcysteine decarboxylase
MKILFGVTSSIAAYRIPNLVSAIVKENIEVKTIMSEAAKAFAAPQSLAVMSGSPCFTDADEWGNTEQVLHIDLAKWCDIFVIAPLTANTLAKIAAGICDNLLTSTVRALGSKPLVLAPAMNTRMWENPFTEKHLEQVKEFYNVTVIQPVEKRLADGDKGMGGLAEDDTIIQTIKSFK